MSQESLNQCADVVVEHGTRADAQVEKWGMIEIRFNGPAAGNPWMDVDFEAHIRYRNRVLYVPGFYDGEGCYVLRIMPDIEGEWHYTTRSSHAELDGLQGSFRAVAPSAANHGPVVVADTYYFRYADGASFANIGTTSYGWAHQEESLCERTLKTLAASPFDKLRMCVFPKHYKYTENEPRFYPFPVVQRGSCNWGTGEEHGWEFDLDRFEPAYFQNIDRRVGQLRDLGVQADVIMFHPYDCWGFSRLPREVRHRYVRHLAARLSAFRNVWWSLSNEYDLLPHMSVEDWEDIARLLQECDHGGHLRGIHNLGPCYDHSRSWVSHVSYQGHPNMIDAFRKQYRKPVVIDECCYEGDVPEGWGSISGFEMTNRFWYCFCNGGYCGHSDTFYRPDHILWWNKGGELRGESPRRLAFLRGIIDEEGAGVFKRYDKAPGFVVHDNGTLIGFTYDHQPREVSIELPCDDCEYVAEIIHPWRLTVTPCETVFRGKATVALPVEPYQVIRWRPRPACA